MRLGSEIFRENLKYIRKKKGLTQLMLAELAGVSPSMIGDIESGRRNPTLTTVDKLSLALDVPSKLLFDDVMDSLPDSIYTSKETLRLLMYKLIDIATDED